MLRTLHRFSVVVSRFVVVGALGVAAAAPAYPAYVAPATVLQARTSWIGNTFGFGDGAWTQINITAIAVAPDGRVFTNSPWDESGAEVSVYKNGKVLGRADGTHGWGHYGGNAIAINKRYVFVAVAVGNERGGLSKPGVWPPKGKQWFGVSRRELADMKRPATFQASLAADKADGHAQLAAAFLMVNEAPDEKRGAPKAEFRQDVGGLAATDALLYVANTSANRIEVYDAETMQQKSNWSAPQPGRLALAKDGTLWALTNTQGAKARLAHYTPAGAVIDDAPASAAGTDAVDVAVDTQGRLLVADNGPRQQVLIFTRDGEANKYRETSTLGERGGIFSGVAGKPGPQRFNGLTGVGADAAGNIYVSTNGIGVRQGSTGAGLGATLESYAPDGKQLWEVQGLLFVDGAWMDPSRPNSVYTGNKRFELDLSKPVGQEWKYAGFLSGRFKYPEDPSFSVDDWPGQPIARKLDGRTFLYLTDMYSDHLKIYRFDAKRDGELAIPSGYFAGRERGAANIPNHPAGGDWIWRDDNGNGRFEPNEFESNSAMLPNPGGWGWWVDTKGDIWHTSDSRGINRFRYGGVDKVGNPLYTYNNAQNYPMPAPFNVVKRAIYEADTDTMYLTGYTADEPFDRGYWKEVGRRLVRYDRWSSDTPKQRYSIALPWDTKSKPLATTIGLTVEGKYLFSIEPVGMVHVYEKDTGREVGVIKPGPEVGGASGWVDVPNGISASRQANGEYLIFVEEDARGKVMMYRWRP
ncbi:hypothetical protein PAMC26510_25380 [Caballeronia sordidicola]|uniref:BceP n=1 Tax=Caballeronia sordidicola TaxID=196367 RepID=A0A242MGQ3_CABSO|nr:hypothetical protein PAMC26510_25380 [Caballeronia sordidicola]